MKPEVVVGPQGLQPDPLQSLGGSQSASPGLALQMPSKEEARKRSTGLPPGDLKYSGYKGTRGGGGGGHTLSSNQASL